MTDDDLRFMGRTGSRRWLLAAIRQGERFYQARQVATEMAPGSQESRDAWSALQAEAHLLVVALGQAEKFLGLLCKYDSRADEILQTFLAGLPGLRELRNMREHEDEMIQGKPPRKGNFVRTEKDESGEPLYTADASAIVGDKIGGILSVRVAVQVAERARDALATLPESQS